MKRTVTDATTDAATRATKLPWRRIEAILRRIADRFDLDGENVCDYKILGPIEAFAHELAHLLDLNEHFVATLSEMPEAEANVHELSTLRIEAAALRALGVPLSLRRLWVCANWWGSAKTPPFAQMRAPLSFHEQCQVDRFVSMVLLEDLHMKENDDADEPTIFEAIPLPQESAVPLRRGV